MPDLGRTKSVAVLGLFLVIMVSFTVYSTNRHVLSDTSVPAHEPKSTLYFDPETTDVAVGETFTISVRVDDVNGLWGYEIGIRFDHSVIEYVGVRPPYWRFVSGQIEYMFWVASTTPQSGQVELMEFTFKGKAEGSSSLSFYVHELATLKYLEAAHDYVGWPIAHQLSEGLVTVS